MKKFFAVALLAVPLTFAAQTPAPADANANSKPAKTAKVKKHKRHNKAAKTETAPAATTPAK